MLFSAAVIFCCVLFSFCPTGCKSAPVGGADVSGLYYVKPDSFEVGDYAVRERIIALEQQIQRARSVVGELRTSGERALDAGRRSAGTVQEIIVQMEELVLWIDWATDRILYLESLLVD